MFERINLVPQQTLAVRIKRITPLLVSGLLVAGCLVVFFIGRQVDGENEQLKSEVTRLERQTARLEEQQIAVGQLNVKLKQMREEEQEVSRIVAHLLEIPKKKQRYSDLLIGISEILPSTLRCERVMLSEQGGQISGKATVYKDLPSFVQRLSEMERFHSVSLQVVNRSVEQDGEVLAFNIIFGLRPQG